MSVESQIVQIVLAFLVLINPLSALPLFLELTHTCSRRERRRVAQMTAASVFVTIVIFTFSGNLLLKVLGISTGSFRVGGGILVFLIAMSMMSKGDNHAKPDLTTPDDGSGMPAEKREIRPVLGTIAVVPLAIPMIMGPGFVGQQLYRPVFDYRRRRGGVADFLSQPAGGRPHQRPVGRYRPGGAQPHYGHSAGGGGGGDYRRRPKKPVSATGSLKIVSGCLKTI